MKNEGTNVIWGFEGDEPLTGEPCPECNGRGRYHEAPVEEDNCEFCGGLGWFGIDPHQAVTAPPGSTAKIAMLSVRYASGVPLWNDSDGPGSNDGTSVGMAT